MRMPAALVEQLLGWIGTYDPAHLLLVAAHGHPLESAITRTQPAISLAVVAPTSATTDPLGATIYDLAIVCDTVETQNKSQTQHLLSRLRDVQAKAVLVAAAKASSNNMPAAQEWAPTDFIALGFKQCCGTPDSISDWLLYRFNIHDYKDTPSWLNARNWANPEQWDRRRW